MRRLFVSIKKNAKDFESIKLKNRAVSRLFAVLVYVLLVQIPISELQANQQQSFFVEIEDISVVKGHIVTENETIYLFEDEDYLIQIQMTFSQEYLEKIKIVSILSEFINIEKLNLRSTTKGILEFDLDGLKNITVNLEGRAPKALIVVEGDPATFEDDRIIIGEKEIELFRIFIQEVPVRIENKQVDRFILTSHDIYNAKLKIAEAYTRIQKLRNISNSDYATIDDIIAKAESLLIIAEECLQQGAPKQALRIAEESLALTIPSTLEERLQMLDYILANTEIDVSESAVLARLASEEVLIARKKEAISEEYILHLENAEDYLSKAVEAYINTVNGEVAKYEISPFTFILLIVSFTATLLISTFYIIIEKKQKRIYARGLEEGKKIATEMELSVRDIILGKEEGE
ncbi:MAG: hypothetical protein HXS48_14290 [Theionarchaea archaeon]|nr:MAG: hypothetical protein AYK19_12250 [Theionarchaea archaeon DG-70-1]MBU7028099.1 hypothetical protein [Theionarchaea archaeon]